MNYEEHLAYLASDRWKCSASPTGAHHWIEKDCDGSHSGWFYCKYCCDVAHFPVTLQEAIGKKQPTWRLDILPLVVREADPIPMRSKRKLPYYRR